VRGEAAGVGAHTRGAKVLEPGILLLGHTMMVPALLVPLELDKEQQAPASVDHEEIWSTGVPNNVTNAN